MGKRRIKNIFSMDVIMKYWRTFILLKRIGESNETKMSIIHDKRVRVIYRKYTDFLKLWQDEKFFCTNKSNFLLKNNFTRTRNK